MVAKAPELSKEELIDLEGWSIEDGRVHAYGQDFPITDPINIHFKIYRTHPDPMTRYEAMRRAHDILWPDQILTFNYWMERMFKSHCGVNAPNNRWKTIAFAGGGGIGKGSLLTDSVRTPLGWKLVGELKLGDIICDTEGGSQTINGIFPLGIRPIYRVTLHDKSFVDVTEDHLWTVYSAKQRDHKSGPQTISTLELKKNLQKNFSLPKYSPVAGITSTLPIDPYVLGTIIANGSTTNYSCNISIPDKETVDKIIGKWPNSSVKYLPTKHYYQVILKGMFPKLASLNLVCKSIYKHLPHQYLYADVQTRHALLQGLMDGDGYASKPPYNTAQYNTSSRQLAIDFTDLARSLGYIVTVKEKQSHYTLQGKRIYKGPTWIIGVLKQSSLALPIFQLSRKLTRSTPQKQYTHRKIVSVEYIGEAAAQCIKVSHPNQLYITKDYIVTHNTEAAARIACIFWLANPSKRAVIVASTTLDSLKSRIFGYVARAMKRIAIPYPWIPENSPPPKIHPAEKDSIHGIYAVSANRGDDEESIKNWIGRHPEDSLLLILDEATDLPPAIIKASANLEQGLKGNYQMIAIGNSNDIYDLHGALSTPKIGWENIDPKIHIDWETTQPDGVCLYFNPYESPAIHEEDPIKKVALGHFLMTEEKLVKAERELGTDSDQFWRFIMGFWRTRDNQSVVMSEAFLKDYDCTRVAEFSGRHPLVVCAGLDPAFSVGGDKCILRLGVLGHHVNGKMVLDFKGTALIFEIKILATAGKSAELQIADQVIEICARYNIPLGTLCVDASGQGRGLADVIHLRAGGGAPPTKIYSTNVGNRNVKAFDVIISSGHEMWFEGRKFIGQQQIYGLDPMAYGQLYSRQVITTESGKKTLEKKNDYKKRMNAISSLFGRSPDEADAAMLCLQAAIIHHGFHPGQMMEIIRFKTDDDMAYHKTMEKIRAENKVPERSVPKASYSKGLNSLLGRRGF